MLKTASLRRMLKRLQRAPGSPGRVLIVGGDSLVWRPFGRASSRAWGDNSACIRRARIAVGPPLAVLGIV
jgi:hypothetical protein